MQISAGIDLFGELAQWFAETVRHIPHRYGWGIYFYSLYLPCSNLVIVEASTGWVHITRIGANFISATWSDVDRVDNHAHPLNTTTSGRSRTSHTPFATICFCARLRICVQRCALCHSSKLLVNDATATEAELIESFNTAEGFLVELWKMYGCLMQDKPWH